MFLAKLRIRVPRRDSIRALASWRVEWAKVKHGVELLKDEAMLTASNLHKGEAEARMVKKTALDMARVVPFLGIVALPGGMVLAPLMAKVAPWALPSSFGLMRAKDQSSLTNNETRYDRAMCKKVYQALDDLRTRAKARPGEEDELYQQLQSITNSSSNEQLQFDQLYSVTDRAVLSLLDVDSIRKVFLELGLQEEDVATSERKLTERKICDHISRIRAEDLLLMDHIDSLECEETKALQKHLRDRGLSKVPLEEAPAALKAWLNMAVQRALPVSLLVFAHTDL